MNMVGRLLAVLLAALARPRLGMLDESAVRLRVLPADLDLNGHMNNGRYLSVMDLGRLDLTARLGLLGPAVRERWMPVVSGITIRFRRSLRPFERYELRTRIVSWDDEWVYMEQRFVRGETVFAVAHVKGIFLDRERRKVPVATLRRALGATEPPPRSPDELALCFVGSHSSLFVRQGAPGGAPS